MVSLFQVEQALEITKKGLTIALPRKSCRSSLLALVEAEVEVASNQAALAFCGFYPALSWFFFHLPSCRRDYLAHILGQQVIQHHFCRLIWSIYVVCKQIKLKEVSEDFWARACSPLFEKSSAKELWSSISALKRNCFSFPSNFSFFASTSRLSLLASRCRDCFLGKGYCS